MELSEIEKGRIKLEEIYRAEVRQAISDTKSSSGIWKFLNSQFGLWLITGALVSFLTWSVGLWNHRRREESDHREAIKKLDFEIPFRFSRVQHSLDQAQQITEPAQRERRVKEILDHLRQAPETNDPALNPDYNRFTLPGLVAELHRHVEALGGNNTYELERLLGHLAGLETFFQQANA